jgi:hypothetical protein
MEAVAAVLALAFIAWAGWLARSSADESAARARARRLEPAKPSSWQGSAEQTQLHAADNIRRWS